MSISSELSDPPGSISLDVIDEQPAGLLQDTPMEDSLNMPPQMEVESRPLRRRSRKIADPQRENISGRRPSYVFYLSVG
jgi:hypothetical protein